MTLTKLYELTDDCEYRDLAKLLFEKIHSTWVATGETVEVFFDKSITTRADGLLSGLSHGVMGCAYSVHYYNTTIAKSNEINDTFLKLLAWELNEFDADILNWKDYRRRSASKNGEYTWSHGLPGNYLAIQYFASHGVMIAKKFLTSYPPEHLFSFDKLMERKRPINDSLCHGAYGILNIIKQLSPELLSDKKLYLWANLLNFCDQDVRELRVRTADPLGLWVGKTGALLGATGLLNETFKFPFLPHQMNYIK